MKRLLSILIGTALVIMSGCTEENLNVDQSNNGVSAHHVPVEKAKQRLLHIASELSNETGTRAGGGIAGITSPITSVATLGRDQQRLTRGEESEAAYYVFRFGDNEGFAIMAADDRLPEMMAIASGTPNQDDPAADLPDTTFWKLPGIDPGAVDTTTYTPGPDPNEPTLPHTYLLQTNQVPVHWGQRAPFNALFESGYPDSIELRAPTAAVAVAQTLTRKEFRNTLIVESGLRREYPADTIHLDRLYRFPYSFSFDDHPDMALNVAKLFRYLQPESRLRIMFFGIIRDETNDVSYSEGFLEFATGRNDLIGQTFRGLGFQIENSNDMFWVDPAYQNNFVLQVHYLLSGGSSIIVGGYYYKEDAYIVHNSMCYDDTPSQKYFLVNKCRGGNGDGYYLASSLGNRIYFAISK